jgi:predicted HTH domain antitoxin
MTQLALELPDNTFSALRLSPAKFVREMRIAAAVQWYAEQRISQEKAAEIAGQSRVEFIDELRRRKVPAVQITVEELATEIEDGSSSFTQGR